MVISHTNARRMALAFGLTLCFFLGGLQAGEKAKLAPVNQQAASLYAEGRKLFEAKEFEKAYEKLFEAFTVEPDSIDINFYLGQAAFASKQYEEAVTAYDRILSIDPEILRVRLELARSYYALGNAKLARENFEAVIRTNPPPKVRENIQAFIARIDKQEQRHAFSGSLSFGLTYDDNVRVSPGDDTISTVLGDVQLGKSSLPEDDFYFSNTFALSHTYKFRDQRYTWNTTGVAYNAFYASEDGLDVTYLSASTGPSLSNENFIWSVRLNGAELQQDYKRYLQSVGVSNSWTFILNSHFFLNMGIQWDNKELYQNADKDASHMTFSVSPIIMWGKNRLTPRFALETENANEDVNSYQKITTQIRYDRLLPKGMSAFASYRHQGTEYDEKDSLFIDIREDSVHDLSIGLSKQFKHNITAEIQHTYSKSYSNIDLYNYDRNVTGLSISWSF